MPKQRAVLLACCCVVGRGAGVVRGTELVGSGLEGVHAGVVGARGGERRPAAIWGRGGGHAQSVVRVQKLVQHGSNLVLKGLNSQGSRSAHVTTPSGTALIESLTRTKRLCSLRSAGDNALQVCLQCRCTPLRWSTDVLAKSHLGSRLSEGDSHCAGICAHTCLDTAVTQQDVPMCLKEQLLHLRQPLLQVAQQP